MRKIQKSLFLIPAIFLIFLIAVPFVSAASTTQYNAADYLKSLTDGLVSLFNNDTDGFIEGLVDSLPLFAVFIIVMGLIMYISSQVIFREENTHKYAVILGIGMALITMMTPSVFNWILNLGTIALIVIVAVAFYAMTFGFHKKTATSMAGFNKDLANSRKDEYAAIYDAQKSKQKMTMEKSLQKREEEELAEADKVMDTLEKGNLGIEQALRNILTSIQHIEGARNENVKIQYKNILNRQLSALNGQLNVERKDIVQCEKIADSLRNLESKEREINRTIDITITQLERDALRTTGRRDDADIPILQNHKRDLDNCTLQERALETLFDNKIRELKQFYEEVIAQIGRSVEILASDNTSGAISEIHTALNTISTIKAQETGIKNIKTKINTLNRDEERIGNLVIAIINKHY